MSDIRINMVVSADEHPDLYALLISKPPKTRASILRTNAEFGIWVKRQGSGAPFALTAVGMPGEATPPAPSQAAHPSSPALQPTTARPAAAVVHTPPAAPLANSSEGGMVLDPSMLAGVNFGDLD